ncbi:hypothetical protein [Xanthomonas nasturtii]|uniref:hypothetical protein n=1 Tax=Xanthomonas nasturtii TaxID=1843581 RepID=UPI002013015E|nr:hypothetical protein [Xanthomonas nasturtii]MCL1574875.1 hypothetical protein [Xanthomonas nasturtii]MCL1586495.1 hypothetical protein [Xanthomonas nasturtii]
MDALLAELLGDVGRVHDEIKALPDQLAPTLGALVKAGEQLQQHAYALSENAKSQHDAHAQRVVATYADRIGQLVEKRVDEALSARVATVAKQLEQAINKANGAAGEYIEAARSPWVAIGNAWIAAIAIGAASGLVATVAVLYATGRM